MRLTRANGTWEVWICYSSWIRETSSSFPWQCNSDKGRFFCSKFNIEHVSFYVCPSRWHSLAASIVLLCNLIVLCCWSRHGIGLTTKHTPLRHDRYSCPKRRDEESRRETARCVRHQERRRPSAGGYVLTRVVQQFIEIWDGKLFFLVSLPVCSKFIFS